MIELIELIFISFLGSERMIILSKANLVEEGINLVQIFYSICEESILVGQENGNGFVEMCPLVKMSHPS